MYVCMFVSTLYKSTLLNRSEPNFTHVSPLVWKRPYGMYAHEILDLFDLMGPFFSGHKIVDGEYVLCDTLISVVPAGVCVTSPTLRCRRRRSHPRQSYIRDSSGNSLYVLAEDRGFHYNVLSLIPAGVRVTSRILRSTGRQGHPQQRYIPHSSSCFCGLQEITSLQAKVVRSYSKCVALSVMRTIRWDVNGIHVSTIRNLIRREGSD
jgi:hypothetical protein